MSSFRVEYDNSFINEKYYSTHKQYNDSIDGFQQFVEEFKNSKLNDEPVRYDIDFIWKLFTSIELSLI